MKILVCGSRNWEDAVLLFESCSVEVDTYREQVLNESYAPVHVIHGDSGRADLWAEAWAQLEGHTWERFPAAWRVNGRYNPAAGLERNLQMLDEEPDFALAFWDGKSTGTKHTIDNARLRGIEVVIVKPN